MGRNDIIIIIIILFAQVKTKHTTKTFRVEWEGLETLLAILSQLDSTAAAAAAAA